MWDCENDNIFTDFNSLYPSVCWKRQFPVGAPVVISKEFEQLDNYWGLIKALVLPPKGLLVPVLPIKTKDGRLIFCCCFRCADITSPELCTHTDLERVLLGTWFSEELKLAVNKGYKILHFCQIWHFPPGQRSDSLFRDYLKNFFKIKLLSTPVPSEITTEADLETYVAGNNEEYEILTRPEDYVPNNARKSCAKLTLNCFW